MNPLCAWFLSGTLALLCIGCGSSNSSSEDPLATLKSELSQLSTHLDKDSNDVKVLSVANEKDRDEIESLNTQAEQLLAEVHRLERKWDEVAEELRSAESDFRLAKETYEAQGETAERAAEQFNQASAAFNEAANTYRQVTFALVMAAASEVVGETICKNTMSTKKYREQLKAQEPGLDLTGQDADHIWPKALGGANNRWNYQLLDASKNRSWQDNVWPKFQNMPIATLQGLVVSALAALRCS